MITLNKGKVEISVEDEAELKAELHCLFLSLKDIFGEKEFNKFINEILKGVNDKKLNEKLEKIKQNEEIEKLIKDFLKFSI